MAGCGNKVPGETLMLKREKEPGGGFLEIPDLSSGR